MTNNNWQEKFDNWYSLKESSSNPDYPITTGELKDLPAYLFAE